MLSKHQIHQNSIITGSIDAFCLVCESHLRCNDDTRKHIDKAIHRKNLEATPYFEKYKDEHVRKVKRGYFCEFCNLLIATAAKAGLHIAEPLHINNKGVRSLKRFGNGIVALNTIYLNERAWQGLIDDTCVICNEEFHDERIHKTQSSHILNLVQCKMEFTAGEAIFRQMDETSFQCLTCNLMVSMQAIEKHFTEQDHLDALQKCKILPNNNGNNNGKDMKADVNVEAFSNKFDKPCESDIKLCGSDRASDFDRSSDFESYTSESDDEVTKHQDELIKLALQKRFPENNLYNNKNSKKNKENKLLNTYKAAEKIKTLQKVDKNCDPLKGNISKGVNKKADTKKVAQKTDLKKTDTKKSEPLKVDSKEQNNLKTNAKPVDSQISNAKPVDKKNTVNVSSQTKQINKEDSSDSDDSALDLNSEEFQNQCELAKFALNNWLGREAFPIKNGIPKFDTNNSSKTKADTKTGVNKSPKDISTKNVSTKKPDTNTELPKPNNKTTNKPSDKSNKNNENACLDISKDEHKNPSESKKTVDDSVLNLVKNKDKALDSTIETKPENDTQNNPKSRAAKSNDCIMGKIDNKPKSNSKNDDTKHQNKNENKDTKQERTTVKSKTEETDDKILIDSDDGEAKKQNKDKLLENAPEYQKNGVAINFETETAFCKQCMDGVTLHFIEIERHIKEHKNKPKQHEITYPILDVNNSKMDLKNTASDAKLDLNHNINIKTEIVDTTKGTVGPNHYVVPYIPIATHFEEVKTEEPTKIEESLPPETNDPALFAKQHKLTYNKTNFDAFCRICRVKLPSSIKCMKEHVYGNKHKKNMKIFEQNEKQNIENDRSVSRRKFKYYVNYVLEISDEEIGLEDVIINEKYCITRLSFLMITEQLNKFRCQVCEVNLLECNIENHASSMDHETAMDEAPVVLNLNNEFVREVRPGLFHCGYCNLITGNIEDLRRHLECDEHREYKLDSSSRLREHEPEIASNRRKQEGLIMRYVLSRVGFRCGVF